MELRFQPGQRFECTRCARCCRGAWEVHLDPGSCQQVSGSLLELRVIQEIGGPALVEDPGGGVRAATRGGACCFLGEDRLCRIHAEIDRLAKPLGCRQFPFVLRPTPEGVVVGVSYYCTSTQRNSGRPLAEYEAEIRELLAAVDYRPVGPDPIPAAPGLTLEWSAYRAFEERLGAALAEGPPSQATERALRALCAWLEEPAGPSPEQRLGVHGPLAPDPVLLSMQAFFAAALVGVLEAPEEPRALTEALTGGGPVVLPRFGWEGEASAIGAHAATALAPWVDAEIARYLGALVFRKFLVAERPLLVNLATLHLLPALLRWYTTAAALARGAERAGAEDFYRALDVVECELVTHASGVDRLLEAFAEEFREALRG